MGRHSCPPSWRSFLARCALLLALALVLGASQTAKAAGAAAETGRQPQLSLVEAEFVPADSADPPPASAAWQRVALPHAWAPNGIRAVAGWYRLRVHLDERPRGLWGVLLPRLSMAGGVWLNGEQVGGCRSLEDPISLCWSRPVLVTVPAPLWQPGANEIMVRIRTLPGTGLLAPLIVGPLEPLRERFERQIFWQIHMPALISALIVASGLYALTVWWRRRAETKLLWFGVGSIIWIPFVSLILVHDPVWNAPTMHLIGNLAGDWLCLAWLLYIHRAFGIDGRTAERMLAGALVLCSLIALTSSGTSRALAMLVTHNVALIGALVVIRNAWRAWRARRSGVLLGITAMSVGMVGASFHDLFFGLGHRVFPPGWWLDHAAVPHVQWLPYVVVIYCVTVAADLSNRFNAAFDAAEGAIVELEMRLARRRRELEEAFAGRRALERVQAAAEERERIFRDLHDDLGAKLLSLAIGAPNPAQGDLARSALQDLRDLVSRSSGGPARLADVLADMRAEAEQRVSAADMELRWNETGSLPDLALQANVALNLLRIVREAISNALRHAYASRLEVRIAVSATDLAMTVTDNGRGVAAAGGRPGRGTANIRVRAIQLGADVVWHDSPQGGTVVALTVPWARLADGQGTSAAGDQPGAQQAPQ